MAREVAEKYRETLVTLTFNNKIVINTLTEIGITIKTVMDFIKTAKNIPDEIPNLNDYQSYENQMQLVEKVGRDTPP